MITHEFSAKIATVGGRTVDHPCTITLSYDAEGDPLAVQMIVSGKWVVEAVWTFCRELLLRGVDSHTKVGDGDVRIVSSPATGSVYISLQTRDGCSTATIQIPQEKVCVFLDNSINELFPGDESVAEALDEALEEILSEQGS